MKYGPIEIESKRMNGIAVFQGTDVPVKAFFEYLEDDKSVKKFLSDYPSVNRKDVSELLQMAKLALSNEKMLRENFPTEQPLPRADT